MQRGVVTAVAAPNTTDLYLVDLQDGTYTLWFTAYDTGNWSVQVQYVAGAAAAATPVPHLTGSIRVVPGPTAAGYSVLMQATQATATSQLPLPVVGAGGRRLLVQATPPVAAAPLGVGSHVVARAGVAHTLTVESRDRFHNRRLTGGGCVDGHPLRPQPGLLRSAEATGLDQDVLQLHGLGQWAVLPGHPALLQRCVLPVRARRGGWRCSRPRGSPFHTQVAQAKCSSTPAPAL